MLTQDMSFDYPPNPSRVYERTQLLLDEVRRRYGAREHYLGMLDFFSENYEELTEHDTLALSRQKSYKSINDDAVSADHKPQFEIMPLDEHDIPVYWSRPFDFEYCDQIEMQALPLFKWLFKNDRWSTSISTHPAYMSSWEAILYGGCIKSLVISSGQVFSKAYMLWAKPEMIVNNAWYHRVNEVQNHNTNADTVPLPLPAEIPQGYIIVFSGGRHVAMSTGRIIRNKCEAAHSTYGPYGHEIIDLDPREPNQPGEGTLRRTTVEDIICLYGDLYSESIHIGLLPECDQKRVFEKTIPLYDLPFTNHINDIDPNANIASTQTTLKMTLEPTSLYRLFGHEGPPAGNDGGEEKIEEED